MSWIFVSYLHCCMTPQISKYKAHDNPRPLWLSYDTFDAIFFHNVALSYYTMVFWLPQGGIATFIRWGGWSSSHVPFILKSNSENCIKILGFYEVTHGVHSEVLLIMATLWIGQAIIFRPMVPFFFFLFSSPNLSGRRLDVYHTSTYYGVALVRI